MKGALLGHIDCPTCGLTAGMRVTLDKNEEPFGYCEGDCSQQLRVGGSPDRVRKFYAQHPHLKKPDSTAQGNEGKPSPQTAPSGAVEPVTGAAAAPAPVTATETGKKPARKPAANPFDFLLKPKQGEASNAG